MNPNEMLKHHVSGAIARGEAEPIVGIPSETAYSPYQKARNMVRVSRGPLGTVYICPFCEYSEKTRRGPGQGRGHGLRTGGAAHSRVSSHIAKQHLSDT